MSNLTSNDPAPTESIDDEGTLLKQIGASLSRLLRYSDVRPVDRWEMCDRAQEGDLIEQSVLAHLFGIRDISPPSDEEKG